MRRIPLLALLPALVLSAACSTPQPEPVERTVVALLLAGRDAARWSEIDEPTFGERVQTTCPECVYLLRDAGGDPETQERQFREALAGGADVVVLDPVSGDVGETLVEAAGDVPVVSYDRVLPGADVAVAFDSSATGTAVGRALTSTLPADGRLLVLGGPAGEGPSVAFGRALHRVLDRSTLQIVAETDATTGDAPEAAAWVRQQLATTPAAGLAAVVAMTDTQAAGVATALTQAEVPESAWPLVTGQDAELAAVRRIVTGRQGLTVYKSFAREAATAARIAVQLARGRRPTGLTRTEGVPAVLFRPTVVTLDNLTDTVVRDGAFTTREICDAATLPACTALGIR